MLKFCKITLVLLGLTAFNPAFSQYKYTRFSVDANAGFSIPNTSINGSLSGYSEVGFRLTTSRYLSGRLVAGMGALKGSQDVDRLSGTPLDVSNYTRFSTTYYYFGGSGALNLERVFKLRNVSRKFYRLNPFLVIGGGFMYPDIKVNRVDGQFKNYKKNVRFYTNTFGLDFKYFLSNRFDLSFGGEYKLVQTYYLDGAYSDKKLDGMINGYVGISYNIGASADKKHMEWFNVDGKEDVIFVPFNNDIKKGDEPIIKEDQPISDTLALAPDKPNDTPEDTTDYSAPDVPETPEPVMQDSTMQVTVPDDVPQDTTGLVPYKKVGRHVDIIGTPKQDTAGKTASAPVTTPPAKEQPVVTEPAKITQLNDIDGIVRPLGKYNVIVGTYKGAKWAYPFRDQLRKRGFQAALIKSSNQSKMVRVCVYYGDDKTEALKQLKLYQSKFNGQAWIHVYNPQ